ncbi:efflux RND transporter permease subunit [Sphingomonas sp. 10B4]|uniref:efflux RND transporter permease subunit n=1 Tax=Sphingomonas sp. 10B4 TaxID=3048575 RepID=UPI002AB40562|nr:efflux RND transporter permease subunit [Sphingomonas sp. 10B4]MDY7522606.1 efflux RND transporter permease subunit [Sphingomonas sp. 10B4]MEB0281837.1 efflux RND transporter permease subunit [Sphingomonas sp. 10B4]
MNFRNISAWSIRNPVPSIVLFFMLTIAGIVSFMRLDVNNQPDIDFPVVIVEISQPGAAPTELETQVTQRVEAAVRSLQGIDEIDSTVTEGSSQTIVQLNIGTPIDRAVEDVRSAISQIRSNLPDGILEPQIMRANTTGQDLASYAAITTDMTVEQLSWYIDNDVAKELLSVPGLATVSRNGGVDREIRVILDPLKLSAQGLTASAVNQQLRQVNLNAAGGRAQLAGSEQSVRVLGNAQTAYALGQVQIATGTGRTIKVADLGRVEDLYAEQRSASELNGRQVLSFDFQRAKGYSDVTVFHEAERKLAALEARNPKVHFKRISDSVKYTKAQYDAAMEAMVEGAFLAVVIVFIFLRDWRSTIISALAIPLSAIPTFWVMELLGFTLNNMTLMALSLVAGVLVDDAIVEIENIVRHMRMGKSAYQASIDAADEIGLAVLATTMAIVAVFLPVGLMPGISGQFFMNFGLTVVASVLMSLAVARLITPMLAAYFLKAHGQASHGEGWLMDRYMAILKWTLLHRWSAVVGGATAFAATILLFMSIPSTFQPLRDSDSSVAQIDMVPGTTLAETQAVVRRVADFLQKQPSVESVYSRAFVGNGRVTAIFKPKAERTMKSYEFERALAPELQTIPDARVSFRSSSGWGGGGRALTVTLGGDDPKLLAETGAKIVEAMSTLPDLVAPRISGDLKRPELVITPRMDLAATMGVTTAALSNAIRLATLGDIDQNSAKFSLSDRQIPIRVALDQDSRQRLSTIQNLPVATASGGSVPLNVVADIGFGAGPTKIERVAQQRQLTVGADLSPGVVSGTAQKEIHALPIMKNLPLGVKELTLGESKWQVELIQNFIIALVAGVFLLFAVLVLLYRRLLPPFVNVISLAVAPLGGLIGLAVTGTPISMPVYIGLIMLLGIVAKNSILLIDFALEEMNKGVDKVTAIIDAGHKRAQPIVMTTVAMVAGMMPTALALTGDGSSRVPMGITVIGGLTMSTVLTLLITPALFSLAVGVEARVGPYLRRNLLTYRPGDDLGPLIENRPPTGPTLPGAPPRIVYSGEGPHPAE